jgi:hypothetical protein
MSPGANKYLRKLFISYMFTKYRSYDFNCFKLNCKNNVKYLSIYFDEDLKWKTRINLNIKRLRKLFYVLFISN